MRKDAWPQTSVIILLCVAFAVYMAEKYGYEKLFLYSAAIGAMFFNERVLGVVAWKRKAIFSAAFAWLFAAMLFCNVYVFLAAGEHKYVVALLWLPALLGSALPVFFQARKK